MERMGGIGGGRVEWVGRWWCRTSAFCCVPEDTQDKFSTLARVERIPIGKGSTDSGHTSTLKRVKFVDQEMVRERGQ